MYDNCIYYLDEAQRHANLVSECQKVKVGSVILIREELLVYGANRSVPEGCEKTGCNRIRIHGNDDKTHRYDGSCRAQHSEIDAIITALRMGVSLVNSTIFITRYPCETCAKAIVTAGIRRVVWGRSQDISEATREIFEAFRADYRWEKEWTYDDKTN